MQDQQKKPKTKWLLFNREKVDTRYTADEFLQALHSDTFKDGFWMTEDTFQELGGMIAENKSLAKEISDKAVLVLMKAKDGNEINGLLEIAESYGDIRDG